MQNYRKAVIASGLYILAAIGAHADSNDAGARIQALMTPEEYRAAGLDKLSTAEREALYQWLQHYKGTPPPPAETLPPAPQPAALVTSTLPATPSATTKTDKVANAAPQALPTTTTSQPDAAPLATNTTLEENFGLPDPVDPAEAAYQLHATIEQPFRGWSGKTVFYLNNGQIWKQRSSGRHTYTGDDSRVVISENAMGFYEMRLLATDRSIGVKRIK